MYKQNKKQSATVKLGDALKEKVGSNSPKELQKMVRRFNNQEKINSMRPTMYNHEGQPLFADGYDHINVHTQGATDLGRALAFDAEYEFTIPVYGEFSSIFALWVWLNTKGHPSFLRHMSARMLREFVRTRSQKNLDFEHPYAKFICAYVLLDRIKSDTALAEALANTGDSPLTGYYVVNDRTFRQVQSNWWIPAISLLRSQLLADIPLQVDVFAHEPIEFENALIALDTEVILGTIAKNDTTDVKPKTKQKKEKKQPAKKAERGVPYSYIDRSEVKEVDTKNVRIFGFATLQDRKEFMFTPKLSEEDQVKIFENTVYGVCIPFDMRVGELEELPAMTPDDVTCRLYVAFNPETKLIMSMGTTLFPDPYAVGEEEVVVLEDSHESTPEQKIREAIGVSQDIPMRIHKVQVGDPVEETKEQSEVTEAEQPMASPEAQASA